MKLKKVIVIGGGFGGMAAALRMRSKGYNVDLYERLGGLGGRAQRFLRNGFLHDAGPTVITAPYLFEELFALYGERLADHVQLVPLDPWYRFRFNDGSTFDYGPNREEMLAQIHQMEIQDVDGYLTMLEQAEKIFEIGYQKLASHPFNQFSTMLRYTPDIIRLGAYKSVYQFVSQYIKHPNLRQAFSIQPLLVGGNPFHTTAIYALIHALEQKWGIYFAMGGMNQMVKALEELMTRNGIGIHLNSEIEGIEVQQNRVKGLIVSGAGFVAADYVITNADPIATNQRLLANKPISLHNKIISRFAKHSMGLFVLFFGTRKTYPDIAHHTIWMGPRYKELLADVFDRHVLADDFSIYLHRPTATDRSFAPAGCDSFYALVPVPNLQGKVDWKLAKERLKLAVIKALEETMLPGLTEQACDVFMMTPEDFKNDYLTPYGSGFSIAPLLSQSAWFRTHNQDDHYHNLFYVGAGTHPGAGVPGVLNSAKIVEQLIPAL
jgi:phytoene desaturase